jgi:hypothetical protein
VLATGFQPNGGAAAGLDIDDNGNLVVLVTVAYRSSELYIYSGCNPSCSLVGGPFQLQSRSEFGHLDASSKHFVAPRPHGLDVYSYSTSGIKYEYSISNGLTGGVEGAAFSPSSKE